MGSQGAFNGPKQGAGDQFVKFSRQSAQRIAKAVRTVEAGSRGQPGVEFEHPMPQLPVFRICTFTGAWNRGTAHVTTLYEVTTSPNTVVATNIFVDVATCNTTNSATTAACAIAKYAGAWYLIAAGCSCA